MNRSPEDSALILSYGQQKKILWVRWCIIIAGGCAILWAYTMIAVSVLHRVYLAQLIHQCEGFTQSPSIMVYKSPSNEDQSASRYTYSGSPGAPFYSFYGTHFAAAACFDNLEPEFRMPGNHFPITTLAPIGYFTPYPCDFKRSTIFLHGMTSHSGNYRIVAIQTMGNGHTAANTGYQNSWSEFFVTTVLAPGSSLGSSPTLLGTLHPQMSDDTTNNIDGLLAEDFGEGFQIYAGQLDPRDASHFSMEILHRKKMRDKIDGWLQDDDTIHMTFAKQSQD